MLTKSEASAFIRQLVVDGKEFHFEDGSAADLIDIRTGKPVFTPEEAELVDRKVSAAYEVLDDPFEALNYWALVRDVSDKAKEQIPGTSSYWEDTPGPTQEEREEIFASVRRLAREELTASFYSDEPERLGEVLYALSGYVVSQGESDDPLSILTEDAIDMAQSEDVTEFMGREGNTASVFVRELDESTGEITHTEVTGNHEAMRLLARDIESKAQTAYPGARQKRIEYAVYRLIEEGADQFTY
jgi:hypothetical protein